MLLLRVVLFTTFASFSLEFFIWKKDRNLGQYDYSNENITEEAVLGVLRRFFEDNPPPGLSAQRGRYASAKTLDELWNQYYGLAKPSILPLRQVLRVLISEMDSLARISTRNPVMTFNNEKISDGDKYMRLLEPAVWRFLTTTPVRYSAARTLMAHYLYMMHSFYSNTNWVTLYPNTFCSYLGAQNPTKRLLVAPSAMPTCFNCKADLTSNDRSCASNLRYNNTFLTSGYLPQFFGGKPQARQWNGKIVGKCGHGGSFDSARKRPVTGGINKETANAVISPHWFLHETAASAAISHTEAFLDQLLKVIGQTKFRELFQITYQFNTNPPQQIVYPPYSIGFAIDTTGSMSQEIADVKIAVLNMISQLSSRAASDQPQNYVLTLFNDPHVEHVQVYTNASQLLSKIQSVTVRGGNDCEEMALTGIREALQLMHSTPSTSGRPSTLLLFTDAPPKDHCYSNQIITMARGKGIVIQDFEDNKHDCNHSGSPCAWGNVGGRKRKAVDTLKEIGPRTRRRRSPNTVLAAIAAATGGGVNQIPAGGSLSSLLNQVISSAIKTAPPARTAANSLLVFSQTVNIVTNHRVNLPVDSTMADFVIELKASTPLSIVATLTNPRGIVEKENVTTLVYERSLTALTLWLRSSAILPGTWVLDLAYTGQVEMRVEADTQVSFLLTVNDLNINPIKGNPVQGETYSLEVTVVSHALLGTVNALTLHSTDGISRRSSPLTLIKSWIPDEYETLVTMPTQSELLVRISGVDAQGYSFTREWGAQMNLSSVGLSVIYNPLNFGSPSPGQLYKFEVSLNNSGPANTFKISVASIDFTVSVAPSTLSIVSKGLSKVEVQVFIPPNSPAGYQGSVTLTVKDNANVVYNKLVETVLIGSSPALLLNTDAIAPNCTLHSISDSCASLAQPACQNTHWNFNFKAIDAGTGISMILPATPVITSSTQPSLVANTALAQLNVLVKASCCEQRVEVVLYDGSMNAGLCSYARTSVSTTTSTTKAMSTITSTTKSTTLLPKTVPPSVSVIPTAVSAVIVVIVVAATTTAVVLIKKLRLAQNTIQVTTPTPQGKAPISTALPKS